MTFVTDAESVIHVYAFPSRVYEEHGCEADAFAHDNDVHTVAATFIRCMQCACSETSVWRYEVIVRLRSSYKLCNASILITPPTG